MMYSHPATMCHPKWSKLSSGVQVGHQISWRFALNDASACSADSSFYHNAKSDIYEYTDLLGDMKPNVLHNDLRRRNIMFRVIISGSAGSNEGPDSVAQAFVGADEIMMKITTIDAVKQYILMLMTWKEPERYWILPKTETLQWDGS